MISTTENLLEIKINEKTFQIFVQKKAELFKNYHHRTQKLVKHSALVDFLSKNGVNRNLF